MQDTTCRRTTSQGSDATGSKVPDSLATGWTSWAWRPGEMRRTASLGSQSTRGGRRIAHVTSPVEPGEVPLASSFVRTMPVPRDALGAALTYRVMDPVEAPLRHLLDEQTRGPPQSCSPEPRPSNILLAREQLGQSPNGDQHRLAGHGRPNVELVFDD